MTMAEKPALHSPATQKAAWIEAQFSVGYQGFAIDVGANDGRFLSNTFELEVNGWTVLCVEANPDCAPALSRNRTNWFIAAVDDQNRLWHPFEVFTIFPASRSQLRRRDGWSDWPGEDQMEKRFVPTITLDTLLAWSGFQKLDVLTVDVEGTELSVLQGFDIRRWRPRVVILESWTEPAPFDGFMADAGYHRDRRIEFDDCYLADSP